MSVRTEIPLRFRAALGQIGLKNDNIIGLSVSGGGDSIAMMHLAARLFPPARLRVVTVDHGLRDTAQAEIALVAEQAAGLGLSHDVLRWTWDGRGNLQASARDGRWAAIAAWALRSGVDVVMLGHTEDDQIETMLMRLARGSGIDGLGAMGRVDRRDGMRVIRPLLDITRDDLRSWLQAEKIGWCEDPSNDDPRFDRVRARQMFTQLEDLGLTRKRLMQTVDHMQAAHLSLQAAADAFARRHVRQDAGDLVFSPQALALEKADAPRRVMAAAFSWVASSKYRPRFDPLLAAVQNVRRSKRVTLAGCVLSPETGGGARLTREAAATDTTVRLPQEQTEATGVIWDNRWFLEGPLDPSLRYQALGDAVSQCPDWRSCGLPRVSLLASPSVWRDDRLIAAPAAGLSAGWSAQIVADFHSRAFAIED